MAVPVQRHHRYHAETSALEANLKLPFVQTVSPLAHTKLSEHGGYISQRSDDFRLGAVFSIRSVRTHVAGNRSDKPDHGWNTLATCVVEDLNVMEVLTVDRIVAQISTDHPPEGHVPTVSLLGTRFENLRIAGFPVEIEVDMNMLGSKPANDAPYTSDASFLGRVTAQHKHILGHANLPAALHTRYNQLPSATANRESIECSLVKQVKGSFPGHSYGHIIDVPDFGKISLGTLKIDHEDFENGIPKKTTITLSMIKLAMGCMISGDGTIGSGKTNGSTVP